MKGYHLQLLPIELEHLVVLVVAINGMCLEPLLDPVQPTKDLQVVNQPPIFQAAAGVAVRLEKMVEYRLVLVATEVKVFIQI